MNLIALTADSYTRSYKYLKHGPGHFLMYVLGRFTIVRSFMVWMHSVKNPAKTGLAEESNLIENVNVDDAVRSIRKDGFYPDLRLRPEVVEQLLTFSSMATCYAEGDPNLPFLLQDRAAVEQQTGTNFKLGRYNHALKASPVMQ